MPRRNQRAGASSIPTDFPLPILRSRRKSHATQTRTPHHRPLRFEPLEDRRMLAVAIVTTLADTVDFNDAVTSLREAIFAANTLSGPDTIIFDSALTANAPAKILLTHGELKISDSLTINGPGANLLTIDASGNDPTPDVRDGAGSRIFNVDDGNAAQAFDVQISELTLTGGDVSGTGGAVLNRENLTIANCVIAGNSTQKYFGSPFLAPGDGGGIANFDGTLVVTNSLIVHNQVADSFGGGGGIFDNGGTLFLSGTVVRENSQAFAGGGIALVNCDATIIDSEILDNSTGTGFILEARGGGISADDTNLSVIRSTIAQNFGAVDGGGISSIRGTLSLSQSTVDDNTVTSFSGLGISGKGAGLFRDSQSTSGDTADIWYSTITGNSNPFGSGGGIYVTGAGPIYLSNSIVARNRTFAVFSPELNKPLFLEANIFGAAVARWSLISDNADAIITDQGGNLIGTYPYQIDPLLGPLVNNGGPTFLDGGRQLSRAPLPGSPAINAGNPAALAGMNGVPQFDQRGTPFTRVVGGRIDIGAVEFQPNPLPGDYNFNGIVDAADYSVWRDTLGSTTDLRADGNGNNIVDADDYTFWKSHFGNVLAGSASAITGSSPAVSDPQSTPTKTFPLPPSPLRLDSPIPQSAIRNPHFFTPPSALRLPPSSHDAALLTWLATQPNSNSHTTEPVAKTPVRASDACDDSSDTLFDALDLAFDALAVKG